MEYLDLCRMRKVRYTSTKPHFANSWVRKPLKYTPLSVRDAFRISTWSLSRGLCFQARNSWHLLFFCWRLSNSVALPVFVVRPHAPNRDVRTVTVRYEYMYRTTPNIYILRIGRIYILYIQSRSSLYAEYARKPGAPLALKEVLILV